jgi:hypothetical protein
LNSGGFESVMEKHQLASELADDPRPTEVLHIGDHDPSGAHLFYALVAEFAKSGLMTSRIGLGTWAMGGWMWGGTDAVDRNHSLCHRSE